MIKRIQLRRCIELLGPEYSHLPYSIYVYKDIEEIRREREENPSMSEDAYNYILGDPAVAPPGVCLHKGKQIKLFPFNQEESPFPALHSVAFAYHEIRHAWQYENGVFSDEEETIPLGDEYVHYLNKPSEVDAYRFAEEQMNRHMLQIKEIIEIPPHLGFEFTFNLER